jgi:hypothetical protein
MKNWRHRRAARAPQPPSLLSNPIILIRVYIANWLAESSLAGSLALANHIPGGTVKVFPSVLVDASALRPLGRTHAHVLAVPRLMLPRVLCEVAAPKRSSSSTRVFNFSPLMVQTNHVLSDERSLLYVLNYQDLHRLCRNTYGDDKIQNKKIVEKL